MEGAANALRVDFVYGPGSSPMDGTWIIVGRPAATALVEFDARHPVDSDLLESLVHAIAVT